MVEQTGMLKCDVCGATFKDRDALIKHMKVHEPNTETKESLEQGTEKPTQDPGLPPIMPGGPPIR